MTEILDMQAIRAGFDQLRANGSVELEGGRPNEPCAFRQAAGTD